MDPTMFYLDWERLGEVLIAVIVFSFFLERALALLFESRFFISRFDKKSLKELIAFIVCTLVCIFWKFDALSFVFPRESTTLIGYIITGAIIAGGSKASIKLFKDVMGIQSLASKDADELHENAKAKNK
jgi:hypothetical protein